jgi:hypothetical protein
MSTFLDDMKKKDPARAADYVLCGGASGTGLRNMIRALEMCSAMNTPEENARLAAAKRLLARGRK